MCTLQIIEEKRDWRRYVAWWSPPGRWAVGICDRWVLRFCGSPGTAVWRVSVLWAEKAGPVPSILVFMLMTAYIGGKEITNWAENPFLFFHGATGVNIRVREVNVVRQNCPFRYWWKFVLEAEAIDRQCVFSPLPLGTEHSKIAVKAAGSFLMHQSFVTEQCRLLMSGNFKSSFYKSLFIFCLSRHFFPFFTILTVWEKRRIFYGDQESIAMF